MPGTSGTNWEIDAKGARLGSDGFVLIECRRHTTAPLNQEAVAAVAYRIRDTGADGGIIVSPLGLQSGAKKVAEHEGVIQVILSADSTSTDYILAFLNKILCWVFGKAFLYGSARSKAGSRSLHQGR